jgi:hypothetical protein
MENAKQSGKTGLFFVSDRKPWEICDGFSIMIKYENGSIANHHCAIFSESTNILSNYNYEL